MFEHEHPEGEEVNLLESGENANDRQDEESFALTEIKQGTCIISILKGTIWLK